MNITVMGTGYVGLVSGTCLSESGNNVICVDLDPQKIQTLNQGGVPIYEPGLGELIQRNREEGRLAFSTDVRAGVEHGDVIFIAVGTPMGGTGEADLSYVMASARDIGRYMNGYKVIVDKSTVPVGTADKVRGLIQAESSHAFDIVSNPEFLKEGSAVADFMNPDRVIIGASSKRAIEIMRDLYEPYLRTFHPMILMDIRSAEMTKYAANCFLATKISFINEIANLCEATGADIGAVREGIGADRRIGYDFLFPGVGYGGSCFPKDVEALIHTGKQHGKPMRILEAVDAVNRSQRSSMVEKIAATLGGDEVGSELRGKKIAVWGLSFKPQTDDMREAPSLEIISGLRRLGAEISAYDPVAAGEARKVLGDEIEFAASMYEATRGADALVLVTEWNEFRRPSWTQLRATMRGRRIFDGRNIWDGARVISEGFTYAGVGRA